MIYSLLRNIDFEKKGGGEDFQENKHSCLFILKQTKESCLVFLFQEDRQIFLPIFAEEKKILS